MENNQAVPRGDESIPHTSPPDFLDLSKPPMRVVMLSPFRHFAWMRQAFGPNGQYAQDLRVVILTLVFAIAGGATGGMVAAFTQHPNQQPSFAAATVDLQNTVGSDHTGQANIATGGNTPPNTNITTDKVQRTEENVPRRRFRHRHDARARLIAIYDRLDFDLGAAPPPKKKRVRKNEVDY